MHIRPILLRFGLVCSALAALPAAAQDPAVRDPAAADPQAQGPIPERAAGDRIDQEGDARLHTDRKGRQLISLPKEDDAFGFVIFGDRTGGPPEGLAVLEQAVTDTNLLDPDLVMTVGDMVQGYNRTPEWLREMREFKEIMGRLKMPWFPVAGNHDVYWRGEGRPPGEHEENYETHFGPLWYAFEHKQSWFVVLYSDEGNPETGEKNFNDPDAQRMSPEQFAWLQGILTKARDARHVFVFLHHPRWLSRYGDDWDRVHAALKDNGNVRAVFAGHIHRMRYDGLKDGIEYFALATTGGVLDMELPQAGYLHHYHAVTVRPEGITVATLPVGAVLDPKEITGEVSEDVVRLRGELQPLDPRGITLATDGSTEGLLRFDLKNPARRPIEVTAVPHGGRAWTFEPDHGHVVLGPGERGAVTFVARRKPTALADLAFPRMELTCDYLADHARISLPPAQSEIELAPPTVMPSAADVDACLCLDGKGDCLRVPSEALVVPDGPLTVEAWLRGDEFKDRRALLAKSENSEFAVFVSGGNVEFLVFLGDAYATAKTEDPVLETGRWHHVAGVYDGVELRAYLDGVLVARGEGSGTRRTNDHPLYIGADTNGRGQPMSFFRGEIDEVRISTVARYAGERFEPALRHEPDPDTALLLHLDQLHGPWAADASGRAAHPRRHGNANVMPRAQ